MDNSKMEGDLDKEEMNSDPEGSGPISIESSKSDNADETFLVRSMSSPELRMDETKDFSTKTSVSDDEEVKPPRFSILKQFDPLSFSPSPRKSLSTSKLERTTAIIEEEKSDNEKETNFLINLEESTLEKSSTDFQADINTTLTESKITDEGVIIIETSLIDSATELKQDILSGGNTEVLSENLGEPVEVKVSPPEFISEPNLIQGQDNATELPSDEIYADEIVVPSAVRSEEQIVKPSTEILIPPELQRKNMADIAENFHKLQQENSELKLQLNASQQAKASLELEIRQKEEIIIKTQAEELKNEQEIKQLKEKLKETSKVTEKSSIKELLEKLEEVKSRESKMVADLKLKHKNDAAHMKVMEEFEQRSAENLECMEKLHDEYETTKVHLSNLENAFSDLHTKYEKTKKTLLDLKRDDELLVQSLQSAHQANTTLQENYESLKSHARAQIEKSNREIAALKVSHEAEGAKLNARIKRLEIKVASLQTSLEQKFEECEQLSALCDEVTGKKA